MGVVTSAEAKARSLASGRAGRKGPFFNDLFLCKPPSCDGRHFAGPRLLLGFIWFRHTPWGSAMTKAVKNTGTRVVRWFKALREKNRPPYRWYEHSLYDA